MKKAEMEQHNQRYAELLKMAKGAEQEGLLKKAMQLAWESCEYVDGMMRHREKVDGTEFTSIPSVDLILRYAPLLFEADSLSRLEDWLRERKRVEKKTSEDLAGKIQAARELMWDAHRLWNHVEAAPGTRQDRLGKELGGNQDRWRWIAEMWERMGLLERVSAGPSYELSLATRMGKIVNGKCSECGAITQAPKAMFLEKVRCPDCSHHVLFTLLE